MLLQQDDRGWHPVATIRLQSNRSLQTLNSLCTSQYGLRLPGTRDLCGHPNFTVVLDH